MRAVDDMMHAVEIEGGDLRMFTAAYMASAIGLYVEIEGVENLAKALTKLGTPYLRGSGN